MIHFSTGLWFYATVLLAVFLAGLCIYRARRMPGKDLAFLCAALFTAFVLFSLEGVHPVSLILLLVAVLTFNGLLSGKTPKMRNVYVSLSLLYIALIHWMGFALISQALLIGMLSGVTQIREYRNRIVNRKLEINRDIVHIAGGVFLIALFLFESQAVAITAIILITLGGIFAISVAEIYGESSRSIFHGLERNGASLGNGALWLALGVLFAVSFLNTTDVLVVFAAILIGDPVATIVGIRVGGPSLPYNSRKSISGTVAYFIVTAAATYPLIGLFAIPAALLAAVVESLRIKIDDNFTVSVALTLFLLIIAA